MKAIFTPSRAEGSVLAPPSKSMAHRALIAAAFAEGESTISPIEFSEDIRATIACLTALGAKFEIEKRTVRVSGNAFPKPTGEELFCSESGSTLRFLIPICLLAGEKIRLRGAERLMARPLEVYETICRENGLLFEKEGTSLLVQGPLKAGVYRIPGNISSQFITGMLFALSLLPEESRIEIIGKTESASYLDLTLSAMEEFGVKIKKEENGFLIPAKSAFLPRLFSVEADYSNAAFLDALSLMGGKVEVLGLKENSRQGDRVYKEHFRSIQAGFAEIDLSDCPDLGPILFALAAAFHGARFIGTARLRIKESDRGEAMAKELAKCGVKITVKENEILVPNGLAAPKEPIFGHNDHRIVMAMSTLLSRLGGEVHGAEAVKKSFPDYFEKIQTMGLEVKLDEAE